MELQDSFLTLGCHDLGRSVEFYRALLSQPPRVHIPEKYAEFHLPGLRLALFAPKDGHQAEFMGKSGPMSLCLEVADLEAAIAHLAAIAHPPPGPIVTASHGREVYAYDPQGNRLIFHESP